MRRNEMHQYYNDNYYTQLLHDLQQQHSIHRSLVNSPSAEREHMNAALDRVVENAELICNDFNLVGNHPRINELLLANSEHFPYLSQVSNNIIRNSFGRAQNFFEQISQQDNWGLVSFSPFDRNNFLRNHHYLEIYNQGPGNLRSGFFSFLNEHFLCLHPFVSLSVGVGLTTIVFLFYNIYFRPKRISWYWRLMPKSLKIFIFKAVWEKFVRDYIKGIWKRFF
jgi:hypothetical protein